MKKRFGAAVLAVAILASGMIPSAVFAAVDSTKPYAEVVFGATDTDANLNSRSAGDRGSYVTVTKGGRVGKSTDIANGCYYYYIGIDDGFMYDVPAGTRVDVIVEYFDDEEGWFNLTYDTGVSGTFGNETNVTYRASEVVYMTNTQTWKTHRFRLTDFAAANGVGNADLRLAVWTPPNEKTTKDITFGSVRIEKPVLQIDSMDLGTAGSIINPETETKINIPYTNNSDKTLNVTQSFKVYDEGGALLETLSHTYSALPNENSSTEVAFTNPKKYGLYTIESVLDVKYADDATAYVPADGEERTIEFSVVHAFTAETTNKSMGWNNQTVFLNYGEADKVAPTLVSGGLGWVRDCLGADQTTFDGTYYSVTSEAKKKFKTLKESGMNIILCLFGPVSRGRLPMTDDERDEWAYWLYDIVTELNPYVDAWEIWNEPNLENFNSIIYNNDGTGYGRSYYKLLKESYSIINDLTDGEPVLALSTAGQSVNYTNWVFEAATEDNDNAANYFDAITTHAYDWSGEFDEVKFVNDAVAYRELVESYDAEMPIWLDEYGFSTYINDGSALENIPYENTDEGYTLKEQAQNLILAMSLNRANGLYDVSIFHTLFDRQNRSNIEHNWGIVNYYDTKYETNPYAAKPAYVAVSAYNHFMNNNTTTFLNKFEDTEKRIYAANYKNSQLGKNVAILQTGKDTYNVTIDVGCDEVEVYDIYGNLVNTIYPNGGVMSYAASKDPVYLVGDFTKFENTEIDTVGNSISAGQETKVITVSGISQQKNASVSVVVAPAGTDLETTDVSAVMYFDQTRTDENGQFSFTFKDITNNTSAFDVYLKIGDVKTTQNYVYELVVAGKNEIVLKEGNTTIGKLSDIAGTSLKASLITINPLSATGNATFMCAQYKNGVLVDVSAKEVNLSTDNTPNIDIPVENFDKAKVDEVKLFFWNRATGSPIINSVVVE